jgi:hypothetical protein
MMSDKENLTVDVVTNTEPGNGKVNNALVWILAFIPAIGALFEFGTLVFLAVNIILWEPLKIMFYILFPV